MHKKIILLFLLLAGCILARSQSIPLNNSFTLKVTQAFQQKNLPFQSSMKPWLVQDLDTIINMDSILYPVVNAEKVNKHWVTRKLFSENLIRLRHEILYLYIDPMFDFSVGSDLEAKKTIWTNTRGFMVSGGIGKKLTFTTEFYENQAVFPSFMDTIIGDIKVIPGQGGYKDYKGKGYDYAWSNGALNYVPSKYIDFTLGYGKNFIGDGYRSMILSDVSFSYPYMRVDVNFWKLKYSIMYAQFIDRDTPWSATIGYNRKWTTMHYLQAMIWKRLNIGLFDAIVWSNGDSTGYRGFDVQYLNPIIFLRPVEFSVGSPDNALVGATFNLRVTRHFNIYGQLLLDEFKLEHIKANDGWWANKYGWQLGISGWNLFNVPNLNARAEYNEARPYTYSSSTSLKAYGHYNQPLAHPLGANFREILGIVHYRIRHWDINFKMTYAMYGADTAGLNYGGNVFLSYNDYVQEYGNKIGQGLKTNLLTTDTRIAWVFNPRTNMRIEAGIISRNQYTEVSDRKDLVLMISFKTALVNLYHDF